MARNGCPDRVRRGGTAMALIAALHRLFQRPSVEVAGPPSEVAPNDRLYAVGDIHGRADLLDKLHELIRTDAETYGQNKNKKIIYVGDYIDRGLDSRKVIDILLSAPLSGFEHIFLKGNHEDMMLCCMEDSAMWSRWLGVGGSATVLSYGVADQGEPDQARRDFFDSLPADHLSFLENLQLTHSSGDYLFVHAGIRPGVPLERQDPMDLMWIRNDFLRHEKLLGVVVVHGHSISLKPEFLPHRIGIDTGAYATNALSCVVLDGAHRAFLSTGTIDLETDRP
jgi:serine/threonine protein phosphatase 1